MAKKYIPGVSGLLTEPNPVDSPANTLSEAENVIVDQRGKVQSRHGFNVSQEDSLVPYNTVKLWEALPFIDNLKGTARIVGSLEITEDLTFGQSNVLVIRYLNATSSTYLNFNTITLGCFNYNLTDFVANLNAQISSSYNSLVDKIVFKQQDNKIIIESIYYIDISANSTQSVLSQLGFVAGQYSYSSYVIDSTYQLNDPTGSVRDNHVPVTSFYENDNSFFKFIEYKNDVDQVLSGYIVKQNRNDYIYNDFSTAYLPEQLIKNTLSDTTYRIYRVDSDSGKLYCFDEIPYRDITDIFYNDKTMYLQTEDGLVETNINDVFQPTPNRYFNIRWPSFPELQVTFRKSDLYQNWFLSGHKCGFRYTFYREVGYTQEETYIYESEPSRIYEIFNDGEDSVIDIQFAFNTIIQANEIYKEFNDFTKLNNGRKFGIKLYRTTLIPILTNAGEYNPLKTEYYQCYDFISFDTIFTTKIKHEKSNDPNEYDDYSFDEIGVLSRFRKDDTRGEFNVGDIISYIPNNEELNTGTDTPLNNGYILADARVQFRTADIDVNDISLAKLKIVDKFIAKRTERDISFIDIFADVSINSLGQQVNQRLDDDDENVGYTYKNLELYTKYVNTVEFTFEVTGSSPIRTTFVNDKTTFEIEIWDYEEPESLTIDPLNPPDSIKLTTLLASGSLRVKSSLIDAGNLTSQLPSLQTYYKELYRDKENAFIITAYNTSALSGTLKVTLNQLVELIPNKKILVKIKVRDLPYASQVRFSNTSSPVPLDKNLRIGKETDYGGQVFKWDDNKSVDYVYDSQEFPGAVFNGRFALSRCDNVYHYHLEAETFVTDELQYTPAQLSPGAPLKRNVSPFFYVQIDGDDNLNTVGSTTKINFYSQKVFPDGFEVGALVRFTEIDSYITQINVNTSYIVESIVYTSSQDGYFEISSSQTPGNIITFAQDDYALSLTLFVYNKNNRVDIYGTDNNELSHTLSVGSSNFPHGFTENYPIRFYGDKTGLSGININQTYYITFNPLLNLKFTSGSNIIYTTNIYGNVALNTLAVGTIIKLTNVTILSNLPSGTQPTINTSDSYLVIQTSSSYIQIRKTTDPVGTIITANFDGTGEQNPTLAPTDFRIKNSMNDAFPLRITGTSINNGLYVFGYQDDALTRFRAFIKDYKVPVEFNDDALYNDTTLYTNPNSEGTSYTNYLAPKSVFSIPFKDYQIYAGIKKPLTATIAVVDQPGVEQLEIGLSLPDGLNANTSITYPQLTSPDNYAEFTILKSNKTFEINRFERNLFIESSIFKDRPVQLYPSLSYSNYPYYTVDVYAPFSDPNVGRFTIEGYNDYCVDITLNNNTNNKIYHPDVKKYKFGATLFERPYLTLKLTSTNNDVEYVSVQLTPFYNRNGYYPLTDKSGEYDKRYLEANNTLDKLNYAQSNTETGSLTTVSRAGLLPGMVEGTESGQAEADAKYSGVQININTSTNKVYYNNTANTLTIADINRFTKDKFEEPGLMLMQFIVAAGVEAYAIVNYSNITTETNAVNKHVFKNITISYISKNGVVIDPTPANLSTLRGSVINFWYMEGTTAENLPIYAYKEITTTKVDITHSTANILEYSSDSVNVATTKFPSIPGLVFKPHRNYESPQVGILNKNGSILFIGPAALDQSSYLDQYAWSIIESFNRELQNKGIKAYLTKPNSTGYFEIVYPDGKQIEMLNGKYDPDTGEITYYGNHEFLPALNKDSFTKVAIQNNKAQFAKNEIKWSRNGIPEIVPLENSLVLGKDTKEFIGAAQSVDDLYLFKEDGIFRLRDSGIIGNDIPVLTGSSYQFSTTSICVSGGSIQEINNEIIYLDQNGFMSIVDGGINNISGAIQRDILTLIQTTPKNRIRSFKNETKGLYYCTLINEVDDTLDVKSGTYIFSTKTRQWTFMDEEILDGIEDYMHRNLVAYRQKNYVIENTDINFARYNSFSTGQAYSPWTYYTNPERILTDKVKSTVNPNYYVTREQFTNNLTNNPHDQYDLLISRNSTDFLRGECKSILNQSVHNEINKEFRLRFILAGSQSYDETNLFRGYPFLKYHNIGNLLYFTITEDYQKVSIDSILSFFKNRSIYMKIKYKTSALSTTILETTYYQIDFKGIATFDGTSDSTTIDQNREVIYRFKFTNDFPTNFYNLDEFIITGYDIVVGVPAKVTFNPESGTDPDTNKLFQEYMIHTETANKGASMAFKTDSRTNFSSDRKFVYDANATNRNVFRTYIPTSMSRGRYLIRQVKHDLPLENLIITGQTIVMRDSRSTRVQKDGDNE